MEQIISVFLHIDKSLVFLIEQYGIWSYMFMFAVIFCETGLIVTPFLPGDSLLFASGALAATKVIDVHQLFIIFFFAAVFGDGLNYYIGSNFGLNLLTRIKFLEKIGFDVDKNIRKTEKFYQKHGSKAIVFGRFIPVMRAFVPFTAGLASMDKKKFITFNILGGFVWTSLFLYGGYFIGNIEMVKNNFSIITVIVIAISLLPLLFSIGEMSKEEI